MNSAIVLALFAVMAVASANPGFLAAPPVAYAAPAPLAAPVIHAPLYRAAPVAYAGPALAAPIVPAYGKAILG